VRTVVVDGDIERQGLSHTLAGGGVRRGWLDLVADRHQLADVVVRVPAAGADGPALDLLTPGDAGTSAAEFFGSEHARRGLEVLLAELADRYDVVIIDAPALLQVTHAATLAACADRVIVVVSHGGALGDQEEVGRRLGLIGRSPLGYIYNRARVRARRSRAWGRRCTSVPAGTATANPADRTATAVAPDSAPHPGSGLRAVAGGRMNGAGAREQWADRLT
jgi:Mrp family chromosome partitioning ATPase